MAQPTQQEVDRVIAGYENAKKSIQYAETIVIETQNNTGEDYTMVWSTAYT